MFMEYCTKNSIIIEIKKRRLTLESLPEGDDGGNNHSLNQTNK